MSTQLTPPAGTIQPTITMPYSTGFLGMINMGTVQRNIQFAMWLEAIKAQLTKEGSTVVIDFLPGGTNWCYTQPDSAWLVVDGYNLYASLGLMIQFPDPMAWIKTSISNQKAFGRVERDQ